MSIDCTAVGPVHPTADDADEPTRMYRDLN
jgi:hypothetical protein